MENRFILQVKVSGEGAPIVLVPGGLTGWKSLSPNWKDSRKFLRKYQNESHP